MSAPPARPKRIRRALAGTVSALFLLWLVASGLATRALTGRARARGGESPPGTESHRLRTEDGLDLGAWLVRPAGTRPVLLLLHGNGGTRGSFAHVLPFLATEGLGGMAVTLRAHGDSSGDVNDFGYSAGRDVVAAVAFLERELPGCPIVIVGESLGASAAMFAAKACAGRVRGYLFAAPYDALPTAVWNRCDSRLFPPLSTAAYAGLCLWAPVFLPVGPGDIRPADHLSEIPDSVPVTIFASDEDRYARIADVRSMAERIRSHATLVVVHGGDHGRFLSLHDGEYRQAILALVARAERTP